MEEEHRYSKRPASGDGHDRNYSGEVKRHNSGTCDLDRPQNFQGPPRGYSHGQTERLSGGQFERLANPLQPERHSHGQPHSHPNQGQEPSKIIQRETVKIRKTHSLSTIQPARPPSPVDPVLVEISRLQQEEFQYSLDVMKLQFDIDRSTRVVDGILGLISNVENEILELDKVIS